jgi:hypothetical protein
MSLERYNKAAYRRAVWREAARLLRERCFPEGGMASDLSCNDVFRVPREVPSEIVQEVLLALDKAELDEEATMQRFKLAEVREEEVRKITKGATGGTSKQPPLPLARKRGRPPKAAGKASKGA